MMLRLPGLLARFLTILLLSLGTTLPARADVQDIAAASRSVVRVALAATDGDKAYFVGHGSGVVIAPGRVLTNAHVVELTRSEPNIVIGIIPAEGTRSYGGRVIAYSPGNDLALIAVDDAELPIATFFGGAPTDGEQVTAIGYPGSVDRAQGMDLSDIIKPMSAVRTSGTVSGGRASKQFDTVLHTAPLAQGNSGGPLVDECGRVIGINSFGSLSEGSDAEYGFAVSNREIASFLRQAGVQVRRSSELCRSMAEIEAAQQTADERARAEAEQRADRAAMERRERSLEAREEAQQAIITKRENMMAIAALLLAGAAIAGGAALLGQNKGDRERARKIGILAGVLLLAAVVTFALRPSFDGVGSAGGQAADNATETMLTDGEGEQLCRLDASLSRVTMSETTDVPFSWTAKGCLNGQTQFSGNQGNFTRVLVPSNEPTVSVRHFEPAIGRYVTDKYLVDADLAGRLRELRDRVSWSGCTSDPARLAELAQMQNGVRQSLPSRPNERLVYRCALRETATKAGQGATEN